MQRKEIRTFNVDLNISKVCNMSCKYCFEPKNDIEIEDESSTKITNNTTKIGGDFENNTMTWRVINEVINWINELLKSSFFLENYDLLIINFWGGEPTLCSSKISKIVDIFKNYNNVRFFIYSNGYNSFKGIIKTLLKNKNELVFEKFPKITVQISYDGQKLQDKYRVDRSGNGTSEVVLGNIKWLKNEKIPFVIKSVISPNDFDLMYESYKEIKNLIYNSSSTSGYFPTIEYYNSEDYSKEDIKLHLEKLKYSLSKIVASELIYTKEYKNRIFFNWFRGNLALCNAGQNFICIDIDGSVYSCHGCLYSNKKDHYFVNIINNSNSIDYIKNICSKNKINNKYIPEECKECDALICLRCNVVKYENSKKENYFDRWRDYANQPILCQYYKEASKFIKYFRNKLGEIN